jgi:hypothetical protein
LHKTLIRGQAVFAVASVIMCAAGCADRVILVPEGTPVQLAEPVDARVFVVLRGGSKVLSSGKVRLPAGAWVATIPPDENEVQQRPDASDTRNAVPLESSGNN